MPDAATKSRRGPRVRRHPLRLSHLIALVAAVALTFVVPPALMKLIMQPLSGWGPREQLAYKITLALCFWTPIVGLIAAIVVIRDRSRIGRVSRSYGISALIASTAAMFLLFVRGLSSILIGWWLRGWPVFPRSESYFSPEARRLAIDAPAATATAIVAVWLILALARAGRRPSDWFDRFCLLFGLLWVLWYSLGRDLVLLTRSLW
jgi:hypothetical protein